MNSCSFHILNLKIKGGSFHVCQILFFLSVLLQGAVQLVCAPTSISLNKTSRSGAGQFTVNSCWREGGQATDHRRLSNLTIRWRWLLSHSADRRCSFDVDIVVICAIWPFSIRSACCAFAVLVMTMTATLFRCLADMRAAIITISIASERVKCRAGNYLQESGHWARGSAAELSTSPTAGPGRTAGPIQIELCGQLNYH